MASFRSSYAIHRKSRQGSVFTFDLSDLTPIFHRDKKKINFVEQPRCEKAPNISCIHRPTLQETGTFLGTHIKIPKIFNSWKKSLPYNYLFIFFKKRSFHSILHQVQDIS